MGSDRHWEEMNAQPALLAAARAEVHDLKIRLAGAQQQADAMQSYAEGMENEVKGLRAMRDGLVAYRGRIENADYRQGWQVAERIDALLALAPKVTS
jgi:hypothetical protein